MDEWKEMETADIGETTVPTVPKVLGINETELGCITQKKMKAALGMGGSLDDENLQKLTIELVSICAAWGVAIDVDVLSSNEFNVVVATFLYFIAYFFYFPALDKW